MDAFDRSPSLAFWLVLIGAVLLGVAGFVCSGGDPCIFSNDFGLCEAVRQHR